MSLFYLMHFDMSGYRRVRGSGHGLGVGLRLGEDREAGLWVGAGRIRVYLREALHALLTELWSGL